MPLLRDALAEARIVALLGPRQAGKSTLARMLMHSGVQARYATLDDVEQLESATVDPNGFLHNLGTPAVIDEIQRAPELLLALKARVDADPSPGQYLITGSATLATLPSVADALPGRVDFVDLWPLSQDELAGTRSSFIDDVFHGRVAEPTNVEIGRASYAERIVTGGFAEATRRSQRGRTRFFDGYRRSPFDRDLHDVANVDPRDVERTLELVAARSGALANYAAIGRALGVSEKTARARLEILERLLLVYRQPPWLANLGKRLVKSPLQRDVQKPA